MSNYEQVLQITKMLINGWKQAHLDRGSMFDDDAKQEFTENLIAYVQEQRNVLSLNKHGNYLRALRSYINSEGFYPTQAWRKFGGILTTVKKNPEFEQLDEMLVTEITNSTLADEKSVQASWGIGLSSAIKWGLLLFAPAAVAAASSAKPVANEKASQYSIDTCFMRGKQIFKEGHGPLTPYYKDAPYSNGKNEVCLRDIPPAERGTFLDAVKYHNQFSRLEMFTMLMLNVNTYGPQKVRGLIAAATASVGENGVHISEINSALEAFLEFAVSRGYESDFDSLIATSLEAAGDEPAELIASANESGFVRTAALLTRVFGGEVSLEVAPVPDEMPRFRAS